MFECVGVELVCVSGDVCLFSERRDVVGLLFFSLVCEVLNIRDEVVFD